MRVAPAAAIRALRVGTTYSTTRRKRFVLIASQFHLPLTQALVDSATRTLRQAGVTSRHLRLVWVPGAFEIPFAAADAIHHRPRPDALIALGVLIRGHTPQYAVLAHAVAQGLMHVGIGARVPVAFGVIIAETVAQARARAHGAENRGAEAAAAALQMVCVKRTHVGSDA